MLLGGNVDDGGLAFGHAELLGDVQPGAAQLDNVPADGQVLALEGCIGRHRAGGLAVEGDGGPNEVGPKQQAAAGRLELERHGGELLGFDLDVVLRGIQILVAPHLDPVCARGKVLQRQRGLAHELAVQEQVLSAGFGGGEQRPRLECPRGEHRRREEHRNGDPEGPAAACRLHDVTSSSSKSPPVVLVRPPGGITPRGSDPRPRPVEHARLHGCAGRGGCGAASAARAAACGPHHPGTRPHHAGTGAPARRAAAHHARAATHHARPHHPSAAGHGAAAPAAT